MAFRPFSEVDRSALRWLRSATSPAAYTLLAGETPVASLTWARPGGSLARARTAERTWTLKRAGFLNPTVLVREEGGTEPIARLTAHLSSHEITLAGAPRYRLRHVSHLLPSWRLTTEGGEEVLHVEPVAEGRALGGGAVVVSSRQDAPETLFLVVLAWYFVALTWFEDEAIEALAPFEGPDAPVRP